jgi:microcystin degradation protein MlrC
MYKGNHMRLGPMALLRVVGDCDVRVAVCTNKVQAADQGMFRHLGVDPARTKILVLKSSVHFRADFQPIAETILVAIAPGPVTAMPKDLPYRFLRKGARLGPLGEPVSGAA